MEGWRARDLARAVEAYGRDHAPSDFAGAHVAGDVVIAHFTRDGERHLAALRGIVPHPDHVQVRTVPFTLRQLVDVRRRVEDDASSWRRLGVDVRTVELSREHNRVVVGLARPTWWARWALRCRYGRALRIVRGTVRPVLR